MSFLKIRDPDKRNQMVEEYLELKKNIRGNLLSEKTGEQQLQTDLSKFYRPITETRKDTVREIREGLKPIKEGIVNPPSSIHPMKNLLENITLPTMQPFWGEEVIPMEEEEKVKKEDAEEEVEEEEEEEEKSIGEMAEYYFKKNALKRS